MRISFMINVLVSYSGGGSTETKMKQYFTILPANTETADDHEDACTFRHVAKSACEEAVQEVRETHDYHEDVQLSATVAQYQFLP